jgi:hypothetical protein
MYDSLNHELFPNISILLVMVAVRIIDGKIGIDPYFNIAGLINTNLVFFDWKIFGVFVYFRVALECFHEHIQVIGIGDIVDFA